MGSNQISQYDRKIIARPLDGIKVTEITGVVAGPTTGRILIDLGATVVKIEIPASTERSLNAGAPGMFVTLNRNKRSLAVNLKSPEGKEIFYRRVKQSDVLVENLGPGAMDRLGFSYAQLKEINPKLIYSSIKGYGEGPCRNKLAYDDAIQNETGLTYMTGVEGQPRRIGCAAIDMASAIFLCLGIALALKEREFTKKGKYVECDLFETASFLMSYNLAAAQVLGKSPPSLNTPGIFFPVYELFTTADSKKMFIGITSDGQWNRFCQEFGLTELLDERFSSNAKRMQERPYIIPVIANLISNFSRDELLERLEKCKVVVAPVNTPLEVLEHPQMQAPDKLGEISYAGLEKALKTPVFPLVLEGFTALKTFVAPELGEHSQEILCELGYTKDEVQQLIQREVVKRAEKQGA